MITLLKSYIANPTGKDNIIKSRAVMKLAGLSTDEKPLIEFKDIEIENGSSFIEIDTSKVYKYDEENNEWIEQVKGSNKDIIIENNALLTYINEITGGDDDNLSDAVATLAHGYGYGEYSLDDIASGNEPSGDIVINAPTIHTAAFQDCTKLTSVTFEGTEVIGANSFYNCTSITSIIGKNTQSIAATAFMNCSSLTSVYMPKVKTIGLTAFKQCLKLAVIRIPSCTSINANAFLNCSLLTDIYLPNDESTYTGAPWGATNATIHYNTQFDENGEPILE